eukprot:3884443-Pleurochrysis_carterae.AAC.1
MEKVLGESTSPVTRSSCVSHSHFGTAPAGRQASSPRDTNAMKFASLHSSAGATVIPDVVQRGWSQEAVLHKLRERGLHTDILSTSGLQDEDRGTARAAKRTATDATPKWALSQIQTKSASKGNSQHQE